MNHFKLNLIKSVVSCALIGLVGVGMSGCGGSSVSPVQQDRQASLGLEDIKKNIQDVKNAKNIDKLDFYAPKNLAKAENHAYKALDMYNDKDNNSDIREEVKLSKSYLAKGYKVKTILQKELNDVFSYKEKLESLHAQELFNDEYSDISESITDMISDMEDGKGMESFDAREQTLIDAKILYSKIKVSSNLHTVDEVLNSIDEDIAPLSYEKAKATYANATFTINKFPDDEKITKEKTEEALDEALYAQTIERESKKLLDLDDNVELFVTDEHDKLSSIYTIIDKDDRKFRTLSYSSKTSRLKKSITKMIEEKKSLEGEISNLKDNISKISEEKKVLESENYALVSNLDVSKKSMADFSEKLEQQKLQASALESKMQNSNDQLLKSKDGALDTQTKLAESKNEIALLKTSIEKEKKVNLEKNQALKDTINKLNKKIKTANSELKKEIKNSSRLSDSLENNEIVIKSLKSENSDLKAKSSKVVVKEVVKETKAVEEKIQ